MGAKMSGWCLYACHLSCLALSSLPTLPLPLPLLQAAADAEAPLPPAGVFYELIRVAASTPMAESGDALGALGFPELTEVRGWGNAGLVLMLRGGAWADCCSCLPLVVQCTSCLPSAWKQCHLSVLAPPTSPLQEAADYDYPRDSEFVPYDDQWGPYEQQEPQQWSSST